MRKKATKMREAISSSSSSSSSKRLLFDRRYGLVIDEWKEPSEEALSGGRGMFCILPLATTFFNLASHSINVAASSAVKALEKPDLISLDRIKKSLTNSDITTLFRKEKLSLNVDSDIQMGK